MSIDAHYQAPDAPLDLTGMTLADLNALPAGELAEGLTNLLRPCGDGQGWAWNADALPGDEEDG